LHRWRRHEIIALFRTGGGLMDRWLRSALDYIPEWLGFQSRMSKRPGCVIAIAHRGRIILEQAFGEANLETAEKMTPRHRFRAASHSKSFTAAGIMKLRERRKLKLDDEVGEYMDQARHHRPNPLAQRWVCPRRPRRRLLSRPPAIPGHGRNS
jgi:hypothetical protein